ncbi:MAG: ATP-grasp domain-containing protein [Gammaproteobacteria bacterium]|nr:ATP-grasp domain-containing protein [Gammaproteobacteria bacterium]MCP5137965.1 ATP-grasp domain-containing protein [Gammaproteobacteria bacterium]
MSRNPKRDTAVAITGFGGLDNPEPGLGVARCLRSQGDTGIHALIYDRLATGAWLPGIADTVQLLPPLRDGDAQWFGRLAQIHERTGFDALLPCLDLEVHRVAANAARLAELGIATLVPTPDRLDAVRKVRLSAFCHAHGIDTPTTLHVADPDDAPSVAQVLGYPVYVKGLVADAHRANDANEARRLAAVVDRKWGGGALLQRAVAGDEYVVVMLADEQGRAQGSIALRKMVRNAKGKGVAGAVVQDAGLTRVAHEILEALHWRGPLELEFVRASGSGRWHLIEVNNRFPAWIALAAEVGCNLPGRAVDLIMGRKPRGRCAVRPGMAFVRDIATGAVDAAEYRGVFRLGYAQPQTPAKSAAEAVTAHRVAITGVDAGEVLMSGIGTAEALVAAGQRNLYALPYGAYDSAAHRADLFQAAHTLAVSEEADVLTTRLRAIREITGIDAVIPCLDHELPRFIAAAPALEAAGIATLLPSLEALMAVGKSALATWRSASLPTPATRQVNSAEAARKAGRKFGWPLLLKHPHAGAALVHDSRQVASAWASLSRDGGETLLAQAWIDGEEFAVAGVFDRHHKARAMLAIKKLVQCDGGNTWGATAVDAPKLCAAIAERLERIGWVGPFEAEFRRDRIDDRFYLIEINPRLPAWISYAADTGLNLPALVLATMFDESFHTKPVRTAPVFVRATWDRPVTLTDIAALGHRGSLDHA